MEGDVAMTNLFNLTAEYQAAAERLADLDLPPEVIADTLDSMSGDIEDKWKNTIFVVKNIRAMAEARKEAAKAMLETAASELKRCEYLQDRVLQSMILVGRDKCDCTYFKLSVRDNQHSVVIDSESEIPRMYKRVVPETTAPDKVLIKEALLAGLSVPGVHLMRTKSLSVR